MATNDLQYKSHFFFVVSLAAARVFDSKLATCCFVSHDRPDAETHVSSCCGVS